MVRSCLLAATKNQNQIAMLCARQMLAMICMALLALHAGANRCPAADEKPLGKLAPPEEVTLQTGDDVGVVATFYASTGGKNAVPIILLHASKGSRGDFDQLALALQRAGHAVIAPDLRGHGDSTHSRFADRVPELRSADYAAMAQQDLEAVKKFLMLKNNAGELNIEKLCVVGMEMGAVVGLNWAAQDWSWPPLTTGKQGQDVKALVLISPEWSYKGLRINEAVAQPNVRSDLSILIIAGKGNTRSLQEAKRLYAALEKYHPQPAAESVAEKQMLWLQTPQTSLQGTRLLKEKSMLLDQMIVKFIDLRLVKKPMPWSERRNPLE